MAKAEDFQLVIDRIQADFASIATELNAAHAQAAQAAVNAGLTDAQTDAILSKFKDLAARADQLAAQDVKLPDSPAGVPSGGVPLAVPAGAPAAEGNGHDIVLAPGGPVSSSIDAGQQAKDQGHPVIGGTTKTSDMGTVVAKDASTDVAPKGDVGLPGTNPVVTGQPVRG